MNCTQRKLDATEGRLSVDRVSGAEGAAMTTFFESRYADRLRNFPHPRQGRHAALLGVANLGMMAKKEDEQIHNDIRQATISAPMPDREIAEAIKRAASDYRQEGAVYHVQTKAKPLIQDGRKALQRIITQGQIDNEADLWDTSPVKPSGVPDEDADLFLSTIFAPDDLVFIGDRQEVGVFGKNIKPAAAWIVFFQKGGKAGPFIIINPLSGMPAPKKSGGGDSYRGDGNVKAFRYCLVEFDNLPREDQIRFWSAAKVPIVALIDTGGKSIHVWLDVRKLGEVKTAEAWDQVIKIALYEKALIPLGVDRACCNPSRLSRLPGWLRTETGRFQRILWLSQDGREVVR